ncbi:sensor histidine kinase [Corynebacterium halotolerans]|nr:PAS domain-containing sensor histidine kinase [Corynebacterium halotolerans]
MIPGSEDLQAMAQYSQNAVLLHEKGSLRILWANNRACTLFQYSLAELRSLKAHHMSSQDERYRREDGVAWLHSAALYGSSRRQWKYQAADGTEFLTDATATVVPFKQDEVIMVEMRLIEESGQVPDSPEWVSASLERIMSHTASGVLVLDTDNQVERASPYAAGLFGFTAAGIIGQELESLGSTDPGISEEQLREPAQQPEGRVNFRMKVRVDDSNIRWLACYLENVRIETTTYRVLTMRDITDRVEAEKREEAQRTQLQYLSRYNAMGDMAMVLAHDLGQPLAASLNFLSGLKTRLNTPTPNFTQLNYGIEMVEKQLRRASDIVASAKRYVRRIESTAAEFSFPSTIEESLYFVRLRAEEEGVAVNTDLGTDELMMEGESVLIGQVIINLCMNAIDEIKRPETKVKELDIKLTEFGGLASLSIADQGRGMRAVPDEQLAAGAFSSKKDGSGIGLIISEHIAQRHGGTILFTPNQPQGTIATLSLPLKSKQEPNGAGR